jgi:hypothetical protein
MKSILQYIFGITLIGVFVSCKKDNYDPPKSELSGKLVYQGEAIQVEYDRVPFELYQYGFGKVGAIGATFAPDGSYSMLLFDGEYKFIIPKGQGPFLWNLNASGNPDSMAITIKGNQQLDIEVTPYYMLRNAQMSKSGDTAVAASFKAEKIITNANAKDIERVSLYINKTDFVSGAGNYYIALKDLSGGDITDPNNISLKVNIPYDKLNSNQTYVFARIGIKISGVEDMIFSPVAKIDF